MHRTQSWLCKGAAGLSLLAAGAAPAHHTYSMFDPTRELSVTGSVAKFEWMNPHAYIWVYVPGGTPGKYDLWTFENGSPSVLQGLGWSKTALRAGEPITVEYAPLRDGRPGGHCLKVTLADGRSLACPGPGRTNPDGSSKGRQP